MEIISELIFQIRKIITSFFVKLTIQKMGYPSRIYGKFCLNAVVFLTGLYIHFVVNLNSLLHLGYYKIGMVILQSFFSISVDKVRLCNFFITRNMVVGSWRGI